MKTSKTILRFIFVSGALIFSCCDVHVEYNNPFDPNVGILPPSGLKIDSTRETFVALSWKNNISVVDPGKMSLVRTVVEYAFQKDRMNNYVFQPIDTVSGSTSSVTVTRIFEPAEFHAFAVYNIVGTRPTENSNIVGTNAYTQPLAPSNVALTLVGMNDCRIVWKDNTSSELSFEIERKVGTSLEFAKIAQVAANTTGFEDTTVIGFAGDTLAYRLRAVLPNGCVTPFSTASIYYPFGPPTSLKALNQNRTSIHLTWNGNVPFGSGYVVERAENAGSFVEIGRTGFLNNGYTDSPPDTTVEYSYRVRLLTGIKLSDPSEPVVVGWWPDLVNGTMRSVACDLFGGASPDGSLIALISYSGNVQVLNSSGYQIYREFQNPGYNVNSVDIDKDNQYIVAGLTDGVQNTGKVRVWRLSDGTLFREWNKRQPVHAAKFGPDGTLLAIHDDSGAIEFVDFKTGQSLWTWQGWLPIAFSKPASDYPQTLFGYQDEVGQAKVQVRNMSGNTLGILEFGTIAFHVSDLKFFKQGRTLLVSLDGSLTVVADVSGSHPLKRCYCTLCEITPDDQYLVGSNPNSLFVIRVSNWSATSAVPSESFSRMAMLSNGRVLFFGKQGVKQYYLQNRWTSPLYYSAMGSMQNSLGPPRWSISHR